MSLRVLTAATSEPLDVRDAFRFHRVEGTGDDVDLERMISAAREYVENRTQRRLITQTLEQRLDYFPSVIELDVLPVQSVTSVKYIDVDGDEQTVSTSVYTSDLYSQPCTIFPAYAQSWPSTRYIPNAVTITFVAGYGEAEDVPAGMRVAMHLLIGDAYEMRADTIVGTIAQSVPRGVDALIGGYKWRM